MMNDGLRRTSPDAAGAVGVLQPFGYRLPSGRSSFIILHSSLPNASAAIPSVYTRRAWKGVG